MPEAEHKRESPAGPGRLVLLVGPSGAGKDTLLSGARLACAEDSQTVFPRRIVTRTADASEDHTSVSKDAFEAARAAGAFAFSWDAHGHRYALPCSLEDDLRNGRTVVCNVSRAMVPKLRRRYARVLSILITAPASVLAERLNRRARDSDGLLTERMGRSERYAGFEADHVIETTGAPAQSLDILLAILRGR